MTEEQIKKIVDEQVKKVLPQYLKNKFTDRKLADIPTDKLQVVPMGYVNKFGSVSGRPQNSVVGQQYFATDLNYPIFRDTNYRFRNGAGSVVA